MSEILEIQFDRKLKKKKNKKPKTSLANTKAVAKKLRRIFF